MATILIVYDSKSGNTEKMARAVKAGAKQVKTVQVTLKKVENTNLKDLCRADAIIVGSPTYYGQMSARLKNLIDSSVKIHGKLQGKVGAAFTSSAGVASGAETTLLSIIQAMLIHGMIVTGRSKHKHYGAAALGSPNEKELKDCRDLGKRVADLLTRLKA